MRAVSQAANQPNAVFRDKYVSIGGTQQTFLPTAIKCSAFDNSTGILYIGGAFTEFMEGAPAYNIAFVDNSGNNIYSTPLSANGSIFAAASDNAGGFYIGGSFTAINGQTRNRIAHINSSGLLSSWNPSANSNVHSLLVTGDNVFIGGFFTSIVATARNYLVSVNSSGSLTSWDPNIGVAAAGSVYTMVLDGSNLYIGGSFTAIGGVARGGLALVNTSATLLAWNPNAAGIAYSMIKSGNDFYIGGSFTSMTATARGRLASVNTAGSLLPWNPSANTTVSSVAIETSDIYVAGLFTLINATARNYLAKISTSNVLSSWAPSANASVQSIIVNGTNVHCIGQFTLMSGSFLRNIAVINTSGTLLTWNVQASANAFASYSGNTFIIGGGETFRTANMNVTTRFNLAAIDTKTGTITDWNPSAEYEVVGMTKFGDNIYVGGGFTRISGTRRYYLASVNTSGNLTSWNPSVDAAVQSNLHRDGDNIYFGGNFATVSGASRIRIAIVNTAGSLVSWTASADSTVLAINKYGDNVYLGGLFAQLNGITQVRLGYITTAGTVNNAWVANVGSTVWSIAFAPGSGGGGGDSIYFGGNFTTIGVTGSPGTSKNRVAEFTFGGGPSIGSWNPNANLLVNGLTFYGSNCYIAGAFTQMGANTAYATAFVNTSSTFISNPVASDNNTFTNTIMNEVIQINTSYSYTRSGYLGTLYRLVDNIQVN